MRARFAFAAKRVNSLSRRTVWSAASMASRMALNVAANVCEPFQWSERLPVISSASRDMVTAAVSSVHAVMRNKRVMLVWGLLLVVLTAIGFATALLGLGVLMPWLAYASWHGYRETLDAAAWPALE